MSDGEEEWQFFRDRPEWSDVTPIAQNDGPHSVVSIAYNERFLDVYDYFRGILKLEEKSERALELTQAALDLNPSNYSVWQYRRDILKALNKDLSEELKYTESMMAGSEKNYQIWHHRRVIVEWAQDASEEGRVTEKFLSEDPKNYHAWQHRQWYIRTFNLYEGELAFVERLLNEDVRNNSAWNQRFFVVKNTTDFTEEIIEREAEFALRNIERVPKNESSWNYLRGIMLHAEEGSKAANRVLEFCDDFYAKGGRSPYLLAFIVDLCDEAVTRQAPTHNLNVKRGVELCKILASEIDSIRHNYWEYMSRLLSSKGAS